MIRGHLTATTDWPLFEQYVEQVMKENHIVGAPVAVADESQLLYARGFGIKDLDEHVRYIASAEYELLGEPGEYFSYCNDTFLLNSLIIQSKSG